MEEANNDFKETISVLMQLDKQSLLLIDSGARLLLARQIAGNEPVKDKQLQQTG